jgi:acyl carrier protein
MEQDKKDIIQENIPGLVRRLLSEHLKIPKEQIQDNTHLIKDLGIDSLKSVEIAVDLEDAMGLEIPVTGTEKLNTFKQIVDYLQRLLKLEGK